MAKTGKKTMIIILTFILLSFGFSKNKSKEQAGGAPGGMPMASLKLENMVKLARNLDFYGLYSVADRIL